MAERIIFHIDVNNAFLSWTAVKLLTEGYKQDIRKIPSIIGGDEKERRGIVLAKSPVAKKFNIVTAEPIFQARKKCPSVQVFSPDYKWYYQKSKELFNYLSQYSPVIEQFSVDECFIDMTGTNYLYKDYIKLAHTIKHDIKEKFGYTVNIGIANNKLCAKMASDFEKPDMVHTLFKNEIETKLWPLPVGELFMVGKATKEELSKLNIKTIKELALSDEKLLYQRFKNQAIYLKKASWGLDDSKVEQRSEKKTSISVSETLPHDIIDSEVLKEYIFMFVEKTTRELRKQKQYAKTVAVFYKNNKFENYSAQAKLDNPCNNTKEIYKLALQIFSKSYKNDPIRLIGIRLADLTENNERQLSIFDTEQQEEISTIQETLDTINQKFGKSIVAPASIKLINAKINFKRQP